MSGLGSLIRGACRAMPRRRRWYAGRMALASVAGAILLFTLLLRSGPAGGAAAGLYILLYLGLGGAAFAVIQGFNSTAFSLARERQNRTLGLLALSDLTPAAVLLLHLWSTFLPSAMSLFSLLPLFVFLVGLGGVILPQILIAYAVMLTAGFAAACGGLLFAALTRGERRLAQAAGGGIWLLFCAGPLIHAWISLASPTPPGALASLLSPFSAMRCAAEESVMFRALPHCLFNLLLGLLLLEAARRVMKRHWHASAWLLGPQPPPQPDPTRPPPIPPLRNGPGSAWWQIPGLPFHTRLIQWSASAALAGLGLILAILTLVLPGAWTGGLTILLLILTVAAAGGLLLACIVAGSRAFVHEKEHRVLDLLLVTHLSAEAIFLGKLKAVLWRMGPYFVSVVVLMLAVQLAAGQSDAASFLALALGADFLSACLAYPFLALALGLWRRPSTALAGTLGTLLVWNVIGRTLFVIAAPGLSAVAIGFVVDFAFHVELLLIASVVLERAFAAIDIRGHTFRYDDIVEE